MSASAISKSYRLIFYLMRSSDLDFGSTMNPFCRHQRRLSCAMVLPYLALSYSMVLFLNSLSSCLARGEQASIAILCSRQNSMVGPSHSSGWISNWLTAGTTLVCSSRWIRWCFRKLLTPMSLTLPSFCSWTNVFQVYSLRVWLCLSSGLYLEAPGQWIRIRSRYWQFSFSMMVSTASLDYLVPCWAGLILLVMYSFSLGTPASSMAFLISSSFLQMLAVSMWVQPCFSAALVPVTQSCSRS